MKKILFLMAAVCAMSFASCGNSTKASDGAADSDTTAVDTLGVDSVSADSVASDSVCNL